MAIERTLFEISVKESDCNREYWLKKPWLATRRNDIQDTDVLVVPWENFRENEPALFPKGSIDVVAELSDCGPLSIAFAVDDDHYVEILLHSKKLRMPAMLVTYIAFPALAGMLGNLMSDALKRDTEVDQVEMKIIVQGENGQCIALEYSGPPGRLAETMVDQVARCFPK